MLDKNLLRWHKKNKLKNLFNVCDRGNLGPREGYDINSKELCPNLLKDVIV